MCQQSNLVRLNVCKPFKKATPVDVPAKQFSAAQRLQALQESHTLTGETLAAWCREKDYLNINYSAGVMISVAWIPKVVVPTKRAIQSTLRSENYVKPMRSYSTI